MKIYVAAAYSERSRASAAMAILRRDGHAITEDWTVDGSVEEAAERDFLGVMAAEAMLVLSPATDYGCGMWIEMGMALGVGTPVFIAGAHRSIFFSLAQVYNSDEEAITAISGSIVLP